MSTAIANVFGKAIRETGHAIHRLGCTIGGNEAFRETFSRHRTIMPMVHAAPVVSPEAFVAPSASVIGGVTLNSNSNIWYGAVLRGDKDAITIGANSNVQDRALLSAGVQVGTSVTIGHGAILEKCHIGNGALIGQGSIIQEGSIIGESSIIAAGAVVMPETEVPEGEMWAGNPAVFKKKVTRLHASILF